MAINVRNKGASAEREVIGLLQPVVDKVYTAYGRVPPKLTRNLEQTRCGGHDLVGLDWLALEVKRCETLKITEWWKQAVRQAGADKLPVLIYRQNGKAWNIRMPVQAGVGRGLQMPLVVEMNLMGFLWWLEERLKSDLE